MSNIFANAHARRFFCALLFGVVLASAPETDAKPYVEAAPARGVHLFTRPRKKTAPEQWEYVQTLDRDGKLRAATRQALALRLFWPHAPEAPAAQLLYARLLDRRGDLQGAFDAYQHLFAHYPGRFEFNEVLRRQMEIANAVMERRKGKFLFIPGFSAPERAIPLFANVVSNAPEWSGTAEAYYRIGTAHQRTFEYGQAIDAYFTALNRFPSSEFAEPSAAAQVQCHVEMSLDAPQDSRAIEIAIAACDIFIQRFPNSSQRGEIDAARAALSSRQAQNAFSRAAYYDRIVRQPDAALMEYRTFLALYPNAEQAPLARQRVDKIVKQREK